MSEQRSRPPATGVTVRQIVGWFTLLLPILSLAVVALRTSVNIPFEDDYGIGEFLEHYLASEGFKAKAYLFLTWQHVQYKLFFLFFIDILQYHCIGHTNYKALEYLGDLAFPAVPVVLWVLLARSGRPLSQRIWLFAFPCYLFLSPRYSEAVNWALTSLATVAVIPFSLASFLFATSKLRYSFVWTLFFLVMSIAALGNGFIAAVVVLYLLLRERRFGQATITVCVTVVLGAIYAFHYHVYMVSQPLPLREAVKSIIAFPFVFLGAATGSHISAALLGLVLVAGFIVLTRRGWPRCCPGSFGAALFCLMTALGVTVTRYRGRGASAVEMRYMMYCLLLISVEYLAVLRLYAPPKFAAFSRWTVSILSATVAAILICAFSDIRAYRELKMRKEILITHLILWERHPDRLVLIPDEDSEKQTGYWPYLRARFQDDLSREVKMGLYLPPYSAQNSLPIRTHSPASLGIENERP